MEYSGAYAVFDGIGSPVAQTFGLGIFEELTAASLDVIERFFLDRGAQVDHEVSPFVGVAALGLLCSRQYRPIEISNVMYRAVEKQVAEDQGRITVRVTRPEEAHLWTDVSAKGWTHEHPELLNLFLESTAISSIREQSPCSLAESMANPAPQGRSVFTRSCSLRRCGDNSTDATPRVTGGASSRTYAIRFRTRL